METTSAEVTELILAKAVDRLLIHYQFSQVVAVPFFRYKTLAGEATDTASFPRRAKNSVTNPIADESTSLVPVAWNPTAEEVSVSRKGIAREPSETSLEDTVLGRAMFMAELIDDAGILLGEATDEEAMALFPDATNDVTDSNVPMTVLHAIEAVASQRTAKVRGPQVFHLHDVQLGHLQADQAQDQGNTWAQFYSPNGDGSNFGGYLMGHPVFSSGLNPSANVGVDRVGCLSAQGDQAPAYAAFGYVQKRAPKTKVDEDIYKDTVKMATITRDGVGTIAANFATKIVTKGS